METWPHIIRRHSPQSPFTFQDLIALQSERLAILKSNQDSELIFAEVAPIVTLGARQANDPAIAAGFLSQGIETVAGLRGGNETWHGPGQWVVFVLTPLHAFTGDSKGVRKAVHQILEVLLDLCHSYLPTSKIKEGLELGIWAERGKLASVGIKITDGYTTSGAALNCIPSSQAFQFIDPCGLKGAHPDFLFRDLAWGAAEMEGRFSGIPLELSKGFAKFS